LERRDSEREVGAPIGERFTLRQKRSLVRDLAYWLLLNNQSDAPRPIVIQLLGRKLLDMPDVDAEEAEVYDHLLLRSGLLREPVEGRVNFLHRTFQEYLAAEEALDQNHVGVLLERSARDDWREVVILAAGLGRQDQRDALIGGLVDRGYADTSVQYRLHLLAVACLETSPALSEALRERVEACLQEVLPPTTMSDARLLSSAGELAVPQLLQFAGRPVGVAKACVRTLALVGTSSALDVLAVYGRDTRVTVIRELLRSWSYFDAQEYAERVLCDSPLEHGALTIADGRDVVGLQYLNRLESLDVQLSGDDWDLGALAGTRRLRSVAFFNNKSIDDLASLAASPNLAAVSLSRCQLVSDLSWLAESSASVLTLSDMPLVTDLSQLASSNIRTLSIADGVNADLSDLAACPNLRTLTLRLWSRSDLTPVAGCVQLESLTITSAHKLTHLNDLKALTQLRSLTVYGSSVDDLEAVASMRGLTSLSLTGADIEHLAPLQGLDRLVRLVLIGCDELASVEDVASMQLSHLDLEGCSSVDSVQPLARCTSLGWLDLSYTSVIDLSPLEGLSDLHEVRVYDLPREEIDRFAAVRPDVLLVGRPRRYRAVRPVPISAMRLSDRMVNPDAAGPGPSDFVSE
jgi:Leucine-rich repeat (LRR) protein